MSLSFSKILDIFSFPFSLVSGEGMLLRSVSSQQRFGVTDIKALGASQLLGLGQTMFSLRQISVTALFYLEDSRRIHP